ncbi:MAG: cob(I)yrinic acid a,c-diamide adenosyltransferase, partial [Planctomycetota bacterium]
TGLFGGGRVAKHALRIEAYGQIDELNALLGWCAAAAGKEEAAPLRREQARLFDLGAWLATASEAAESARMRLPRWDQGAPGLLEGEIDALEAGLPALANFILPGGSEAAARLHIARTVCRRAERALVRLSAEEEVPAPFLAYLNRLSDWLFVRARKANADAGVEDTSWR